MAKARKMAKKAIRQARRKERGRPTFFGKLIRGAAGLAGAIPGVGGVVSGVVGEKLAAKDAERWGTPEPAMTQSELMSSNLETSLEDSFTMPTMGSQNRSAGALVGGAPAPEKAGRREDAEDRARGAEEEAQAAMDKAAKQKKLFTYIAIGLGVVVVFVVAIFAFGKRKK